MSELNTGLQSGAHRQNHSGKINVEEYFLEYSVLQTMAGCMRKQSGLLPGGQVACSAYIRGNGF